MHETLKNKIVAEYGTPRPNGQIGIEPGDPKWDEFVVLYAELLAEPIEVDIKPISIPSEGLKIAPASMVALIKFVTFK